MHLEDSGARLDAFCNSRLERGVGEEGGTKTLSTRTLCRRIFADVCAMGAEKSGSGSAELLLPGGLSQRQWFPQECGK